MPRKKDCVIGLDYGTDSVRALVMDCRSGEELGTAVDKYRRWTRGDYCSPAENRFRQHPLDYLESLGKVVSESLEQSPAGTASRVGAISIDTTGSSPVAVDETGTALALKDEFADNPNAMFVLWKDHTAIREAEEINGLARNWGGEDYTKYCGGIYSSEWFWAKILHVLREDEKVRNTAFSWVEHCDWLPALLTGNTNPLEIRRSRCAAGHKAMWHESFGGLPSEEFLQRLDPMLAGLRDRLYTHTCTSDTATGTLCSDWAEALGLDTDVSVGVGALDGHMGAVGGQIKPYSLVKVMGTSTCDMIIAPMEDAGDKLIKGICGQVDGSIVPGMLGMEAGQSAFGDLYAWYRDLLMWPLKNLPVENEKISSETKSEIIDKFSEKILEELGRAAARKPPGESGIVALDWINGRRTPDADQGLKSALSGLSMGSDAPAVYRALVEATAFGAKKIVDRFEDEGIEIKEVIALGGVAKKSDFVMQTVADVLGLEIKVVESGQACALGAAMFAAVVAGIYRSVPEAQDAMGSGFSMTYRPNPENSAKYAQLYEQYSELGKYMESRRALK